MSALTIFGTDLARPAPASQFREGLVFSTETIALTSELARHFDLGFEEVADMLAPVLPRSTPSLRSPAGWTLFAQYVATSLPAPSPPYQPTLH